MDLKLLVKSFSNEELLILLENVNDELALRGVLSTEREDAPLQSEVPKLDLDRVIPFIQEMKERIGDSQIKWLSVYCVLRKYNLIAKEMTTFCELIKEKFGKNLNNKELSRQCGKSGVDYTLWDAADKRVKDRQQIAVDLNQKIEDLKKTIATARQAKLKAYIGQ